MAADHGQRVYTVEEANASLPAVRADVQALRDEMEALRFAQEQLVDLQNMWGDTINDPTCRDHDVYCELLEEVGERKQTVGALLDRFDARGVQMKDPILGLVDFFGERDGELVYLCWQDGEEAITHWHPLHTGFAGRRLIEEW